MQNCYIAPKIKIGFQKREDCFTKKLAYVIYFDDKGKLRKEKSWNSWRSKDIPVEDYDNVPTSGFTINRDIKRYSGEWFSSHRTMVRIHDPRGFEFEVTTENLIGILMHTDCLRRGLIGEFVYAWFGTELVLLPTNSEEYQNATKFTAGLSKKVKAKELIVGASYKTKREGDVVYLGKFNWYEYKEQKRYESIGLRQESKVMVFTADDGKTFMKKNSVDFLSEANSDQPVSNYAELVEKFNNKLYANKIVKYEFKPVQFDPTLKDDQGTWLQLKRDHYLLKNKDNVYYTATVTVRSKNNRKEDGSYGPQTVGGYEYSEYCGRHETGIKEGTGEIVTFNDDCRNKYQNYSHWSRQYNSLEQMNSIQFYDLCVTFENGKERKFDTAYKLTSEE